MAKLVFCLNPFMRLLWLTLNFNLMEYLIGRCTPNWDQQPRMHSRTNKWWNISYCGCNPNQTTTSRVVDIGKLGFSGLIRNKVGNYCCLCNPQSLLPRGEKPNSIRTRNEQVNVVLKSKVVDREKVQFVDIDPGFVQPDGKFEWFMQLLGGVTLFLFRVHITSWSMGLSSSVKVRIHEVLWTCSWFTARNCRRRERKYSAWLTGLTYNYPCWNNTGDISQTVHIPYNANKSKWESLVW